jgi:hypothetical protein
MIVFLSAPDHAHEVAAFVNGRYAPGLPRVRRMNYHRAFWADKLPVATYVFTDFERLYPWEQICAANLYRTLTAMGQRCLNDPARAMTRFELLRALYRAGFNPFNLYRAEDDPRPERFPVFIRAEAAHDEPLTGLLETPAALAAALAGLAEAGWPRRLLLVVEFWAAPIAPGVWRKHGTMRIGDEIFPAYDVIDAGWVVKHGTYGLASAAMQAEEFVHVHGEDVAGLMRPVFDLAGIEYGRADHASAGGREVIYEINSYPQMGAPRTQRTQVRQAAMARCAAYVTAALHRIDTASGGWLALPPLAGLPRRHRAREFILSRR